MILVDTSIWIDHLHNAESRLVKPVTEDAIGCHPLVLEELALGSMKQRDVILDLLSNPHQFPTVTHPEMLHLVEHRRLGGRGLSVVDVQLLGAVALVDGAQFWTRDKRLKAVCAEIDVALAED